MTTDLYIKSQLFPKTAGEEENINPGRFGYKLSEFVKNALLKDGIKVADVYTTDYSYELRIDEFSFPIYIQTGNIDGEDSSFLISIEPKKPYIRKLFKKISTAEPIERIYKSIFNAIQSDNKIELE